MFYYTILVQPFDGWGAAYVWGVYDTEERARDVLRELCGRFNLEYNPDEPVAYNHDEPCRQNRYDLMKLETHLLND